MHPPFLQARPGTADTQGLAVLRAGNQGQAQALCRSVNASGHSPSLERPPFGGAIKVETKKSAVWK